MTKTVENRFGGKGGYSELLMFCYISFAVNIVGIAFYLGNR